jgi:hypothetical protein
MHLHPHISAALAAGRVADFYENASVARRASSADDVLRRAHLSPGIGSIRLNAYPRLCGLPVSIDRPSLALEALAETSTDAADTDAVHPDKEHIDDRAFGNHVPYRPRARRWGAWPSIRSGSRVDAARHN